MKTCPSCGQANPTANGFCTGCGVPLPEAKSGPTVSTRPARPSFSLPDYVERDASRRAVSAEGAGSGLVWTGLPLTVGSLLMSSGSTVGTVCWAAGILLVVAGFWRMRNERRAFGRAGLVTSVVSVVALGGVVLQLVRFDVADPAATEVAAIPTPTPDLGDNVGATPDDQGGAVVTGAVPMFRGNPGHTGVHPGPGPSGDPRTAWKLDTGGELYSSPAVADGLVFVGTKSGYLLAVDAATGEERWRQALDGYIIRSSPAVVDGVVYIGGGYTLYAFDAASGAQRWRFSTRYSGPSSPVVVDGVVYAGTQEGYVYAVDADTGHERWRIKTDGLVFSSPAVAEGRLFVGSDDGDLYAFDADGGRLLWRFPTGGEVYASPAVAGDTVYVSSKSQILYAVDAASGEERWRWNAGGDASPAVADGVVYLGSDDNGLYALDGESGEARWLFPTGAPIRLSPVVAGDTVYVGSGATLYAVAAGAEAGTRRWSYVAGDRLESSPAVVGGAIFVGGRDGFLYAIGGSDNPTPAAS